MKKETKGMGGIDVEETRDFYRASDERINISVYEDERLKSRSIGFVWPETTNIILSK